MKAIVTTRINIIANKEEVFRYLSELKLHTLWNPHLRKVSSKKKLLLGSTYTTDSMVLNIRIQAKNVVTEFSEPRIIEITNNTGTIQFCVKYRVIPRQHSTLVVCSTAVSTESKAHIFSVPLLKRLARHELQSDMRALKIAVEHRLK